MKTWLTYRRLRGFLREVGGGGMGVTSLRKTGRVKRDLVGYYVVDFPITDGTVP